LIDKPVGWTSFDVVAKVRGMLRQQLKAEGTKLKVKVGHTGTLDPLATGLLVLLIGNYTKRAEEYTKSDKTYEVTMKLGETSTTGDEEGEKTQVSTHQPTKAELQAAFEQFSGEIMQTPPQFSAIKVDGQRAYKLARAGKEVKLEPRQVTVYRLELTDYKYPSVQFTTEVSSGTYIRSLVKDIGKELSTDAYMTALRRTKVGRFNIQNAIDPTKINIEHIQANISI